MYRRRLFSLFTALILIATGVPLSVLAGESAPADDTPRFVLIYDGPAVPAAIDSVDIGTEHVMDSATRAGTVTLASWVGQPDAIGPGDELVLNLFADASYVATVDRLSVDVNDVISVRGRLKDYPHGYAIISTHEGRTIGSIVVPEEDLHYFLFYEPESSAHVLAQLDRDMMDVVQEAPPLFSPASDALEEDGFVILQDGVAVASGPDDPATIDVMVVYTGAAEDWAASRGGIESIIAQAMATAQLVMDNSDTGVTMQLVYTAKVNYTETNNGATDLTRLTGTNNGYMDEVHDWRDEYGADLVSMFAYVSNYGGVAWLLSSASGQPAYGFSITRVQQAATGYTHVHEMGHNMGTHHHKEQNTQPGPGLFSYSAGWRWVASDGKHWCTVMTYEHGSYFADGQTHARLPYFSNPQVSHQGSSTGDATHGDNARTIREVKHAVALYRSTQSLPPSVNTGPATDISTDSARLHGDLDSLGDHQSADVSFEWWTDAANKRETDPQTMSAPGAFSTSIAGLEPETVYHCRAKATADGVTVYGEQVSFVTLPVEPGPAVELTVSPREAMVTAGSGQAYTAAAIDSSGYEFDVTADTIFAIDEDAGGSWADNVYASETAGVWTVTATYGGLTDTATLIVEAGSAVTLSIAPEDAAITAGESQTYTATARDSSGNEFNVTADTTFTIDEGAGGTWAGNIYASETAGVWTVSATYGDLSDTATLTVTESSAVALTISPHETTVTAGEGQVYSVTARDSAGNEFDVTADTTITIDEDAAGSWADNVYTSETAGVWTVSATYGDLSDTATLTVTESPAVALTISPQEADITAGESQAYTATATDGYGNEFNLTLDTTFTVDEAAGGAWNDNVYTSETAGVWTVTATYGGLTDTATLIVEDGPAVTLSIAPEDAAITAGESQTYTATARDSSGNEFDVTADTTFTIDEDAAGSWADNVYTSETAGVWTVTAAYEDLTDTATLIVEAGSAVTLAISPPEADITAGDSQTYTATASDGFGNELDVTADTTFTIDQAAGGDWRGNVYISEAAGTWTVAGLYGEFAGEATLIVNDLPRRRRLSPPPPRPPTPYRPPSATSSHGSTTGEAKLFGSDFVFDTDAETGELLNTTTAISQYGSLVFNIPAATIALDADGNPLSGLTVEVRSRQPATPDGCFIIGHSYVFCPAGGSVLAPGEATFMYEEGVSASLVAEPEEGHRFVR